MLTPPHPGAWLLALAGLASWLGPCIRVHESAKVVEAPDLPPARAVPDGLQATLPSGFTFTVHGEFTQRQTMWPDASLMFSEYRDIYVLDGGESVPRLVHHNDDNYGVMLDLGTALSADRTRVYAWIDPFEQLSAIDLASGQMQSLTELPTISGVEFRRGLEPHPVARLHGVVEEPDGRLGFVIQANAPERQHSAHRTKGHRILAVDPTTRELSQSADCPGKVSAWDYSPSRQLLYLLVDRDDAHLLAVRQLDGKLVREVPLAEHGDVAGRVALSPDESTLLIERVTRSTIEGRKYPLVVDAGFMLVDTTSFEVREGPARGLRGSWSPIGQHIAYHAGWTLRLWDVTAGSTRTLLTREPSTANDVPEYCAEPRWSEDGLRLAVRLGYDRIGEESQWATVALDLESRELLVLTGELDTAGLTWLPVPHPFVPPEEPPR